MSSEPNAPDATPDPPSAPRRRRGFGTLRFSERDRWLLAFVGEQFAVTIHQLARVNKTTVPTAGALRDRWCKAGWVESRQLTQHGPGMVWLTAAGIRAADSPYGKWRPNGPQCAHIEAVTEVRLLLERQLDLGDWRCERELTLAHAGLPEPRPHRPDALLDTGREQIAIEVELTLKSQLRLEAILAETGQSYDQVWYFAAPGVVTRLSRCAADAPWQNICIHPYPPRPEDLFA